MQQDKDFLNVCEILARNSYAERNKVGCIITLDRRIVSSGYNGTIQGRPNVCENDEKTLPEVVHAEENAILFALRNSNIDLSEAVLYVNLSPCFNCAKLIKLSGIKTVIFSKPYRDQEPIEWLKEVGVRCIQIN